MDLRLTRTSFSEVISLKDHAWQFCTFYSIKYKSHIFHISADHFPMYTVSLKIDVPPLHRCSCEQVCFYYSSLLVQLGKLTVEIRVQAAKQHTARHIFIQIFFPCCSFRASLSALRLSYSWRLGLEGTAGKNQRGSSCRAPTNDYFHYPLIWQLFSQLTD